MITFDLNNKTAIVTDAASGLGKAIAKGLSDAGANVIIADWNYEGALETAKELATAGNTIKAYKAGVIALTNSLSREVALNNININAVCPGIVRTPMLEKVLRENPELEAASVNNLPLPPHHTTTLEVAYAVLYLASDESSSVTGTEMVVDCGFMMK